METKICKRCGKELPKECFSVSKRSKDGLQSYCKECRKEYYQENKQAELEQNKVYHSKHKVEIAKYQKVYHRQYTVEHREELNEYQKQWYNDNREAILEYWKRYSETLRGHSKMIRQGNISADRKQGRIGDELPPNYPTIEDYMELLQQRDFYDGKQYHFTEMGLDRIDNSKPHTLGNVVPCTTKHNIERHTIPFDVFKAKFNKYQPI